MIEIDGSIGEGGGQVLRTSLALSVVTGTPLTLTRIRAGRPKSGLLRQHLTCVRAAAAICGAAVDGDTLGSTRIVFRPGPVVPGSYAFAIGSAGSANLVLQTVLPPLLLAGGPSIVEVEGGTHNSASPPFHFLQQVFAPHVGLSVELLKWGFFPAGGGKLRATVTPGRARIERLDRGSLELSAHAATSGISPKIGHAALGIFKEALSLGREQLKLHEVSAPVGPGFAVWIEARFPGGSEIFTAFGERRSSPDIAHRALAELEAWRILDVPVGEHLADQLLIPLALFGGRFRTGPLSLHARTNIEVIERFLPVRFRVEGGEVTVDV